MERGKIKLSRRSLTYVAHGAHVLWCVRWCVSSSRGDQHLNGTSCDMNERACASSDSSQFGPCLAHRGKASAIWGTVAPYDLVPLDLTSLGRYSQGIRGTGGAHRCYLLKEHCVAFSAHERLGSSRETCLYRRLSHRTQVCLGKVRTTFGVRLTCGCSREMHQHHQ